ncbi:MAG: hypothetical protein M1816_000381 [Peltula sp. TS41687]|nr:MAG: hypothetical protein M1816_000381 [Peltula sp. TS41687]
MSFDKQQPNNHISRPLLPTTFHAPPTKACKTPLTPRIAAAASSSSSVSPVLRRGPQPQKGLPPKGVSQDDLSTPVKAFLSSNITPRSGSRKARVDSTSSTPNETPNGTPGELRVNTAIAAPLLAKHSILGPNGLQPQAEDGTRKRPASVIIEGRRNQYDRRSPEAASDQRPEPSRANSTIFRADDAKSALAQSPLASEKPDSQIKAPCFFYANGDSLEPELVSPSIQSGFSHNVKTPSSSVVSARRRESLSSHLSHAWDASAQRLHSPDEARSPSLVSPPIVVKNATLSTNHNRQVSPAYQTPSPSSIPIRTEGTDKRAESSLRGSRLSGLRITGRTSSHGRSASVGSVDRNFFKRGTIDSSSGSSTPSTKASKRVSLPLAASSPQSSESCISPPNHQATSASPTTKPTLDDSPKHKLQQMNELAANARRERKVLDLEISNSSLMAINRTLEREMRKQNAELRRFRRLSRSGRLSLATQGSKLPRPCRSSSLSTAAPTDDSPDLSNLLSDQSEDETSETDLEEDDSSSAAETDDVRHRERDERRLQLDLSKHQRLLIDSQKMNMSLKRCLGLSGELIQEAKRALDFKVRVSDIRFGGRVLLVDDSTHAVIGKGGEDF